MSAFEALNYMENGGKVLVSLPGFVSSVFMITEKGIESGNTEIGLCFCGLTPGKTYKHFQNILNEGGELTAI